MWLWRLAKILRISSSSNKAFINTNDIAVLLAAMTAYSAAAGEGSPGGSPEDAARIINEAMRLSRPLQSLSSNYEVSTAIVSVAAPAFSAAVTPGSCGSLSGLFTNVVRISVFHIASVVASELIEFRGFHDDTVL